jgi:hypothetical protein
MMRRSKRRICGDTIHGIRIRWSQTVGDPDPYFNNPQEEETDDEDDGTNGNGGGDEFNAVRASRGPRAHDMY